MRRALPLVCLWVVSACSAGGSGEPTPTEPKEAKASDWTEPAEDPPPQGAKAVELAAADGVTVFGDFYAGSGEGKRPVILLFHQAGSNAREYTTIAPRLNGLGFDALAIDQRSGGDSWDGENRTVHKLGGSTGYLETYPDLEAALAWAEQNEYETVLAWGSSYSSSLVFKLAADHGDDLAAILSFSPGEYIKGQDKAVETWASKVEIPVFVTSGTGDEIATAKTILAASPSEKKTQFEPTQGVHGSSTLRDEQNHEGMAENWAAVEAFLAAFSG